MFWVQSSIAGLLCCLFTPQCFVWYLAIAVDAVDTARHGRQATHQGARTFVAGHGLFRVPASILQYSTLDKKLDLK